MQPLGTPMYVCSLAHNNYLLLGVVTQHMESRSVREVQKDRLEFGRGHVKNPYSTYISSFLQQHPYFFVHFKNVFSFLLTYVIFVQYGKRCSKNIQDRSKIEMMPIRRYNYIDKNVDYES